jgi:hypothetical protein
LALAEKVAKTGPRSNKGENEMKTRWNSGPESSGNRALLEKPQDSKQARQRKGGRLVDKDFTES